MPHPFHAANKHLIQAHPADWLTLAGLDLGTSLEVVDADLSAVSAASDKFIRVNGRRPYGAHVEFQSGPHRALDNQVLLYNVLGRDRLELPIRSVVFLLRPQALAARVHGGVFDEEALPEFRLHFAYKLIRVWELATEKLLVGGLGTLPLAPISKVRKADLPRVIETMAGRLERETPPEEAAELWTATKILMGLRWSKDLVGQLLRGVRNMKESVTYQEILEEGFEKGIEKGIEEGETKGRISEARALVTLQGTQRFGKPTATARQTLDAVDDLRKLTRMMSRMLDMSVKSWEQLLEVKR